MRKHKFFHFKKLGNWGFSKCNKLYLNYRSLNCEIWLTVEALVRTKLITVSFNVFVIVIY